MQRDMELLRQILLKIEMKHKDVAIYNLSIEGIDTEKIGYHCKLAYEADLIDSYKPQYADNKLYSFAIGGLTWKGHDYLELIRNEEVWLKTKNEVEEKELPRTIEFIAKIAGRFAGAMIDEMN